METIQEIILLFLIIIPIGAAGRITLCCIYAAMAEDSTPYKKRAKNTAIFAVLAECVAGFLEVIALYFGGVIF